MSNNIVCKCRIYPNKRQERLINLTFKVCSEIHNLMIIERAYLYNKFILYVQRCLINRLKIDEERFFKHNRPKTIDSIKKMKPIYSQIDEFAIYSEQINIISSYDKYFSGAGAFPGSMNNKRLIYNTMNVDNSIYIKGSDLVMPKLGRIKFKYINDLPQKLDIQKVSIKLNSNGKYYAILIA